MELGVGHEWILLAVAAGGVVLGAVGAWLLLRGRIEAAFAQGQGSLGAELARAEERAGRVSLLEQELHAGVAALDESRRQLADLREQAGGANAELRGERERLQGLRIELQAEKDARLSAEREASRLRAANAELSTRLEEQHKQAEEKLALLGEAREKLTEQFKNLAAEILEDKSKRFTEQNQLNIGQMLDPLKAKIIEFQSKVELAYDAEGKQRSVLADQVRQLLEMNQQLSKDANDLTQALKGSTKTQGNWGEMILERVLEDSGLRKGEEYDVQESHQREDGSRAQPDVVIHLPEQRHLVVDAKVSLTAYEEYSSAAEDVTREAALKRHLDSIRAHIKGLSERNYQELHGIASPDFVLMFIPLEPAFMLAVTQDRELFMQAWHRNVLLVSPSTLLFVVRTVAHLWRQEQQSRNAQEIAKRGAELYDKLVGFVESLESVGARIAQAQKDYDTARSRLTGKGGAVRQAEMLRDLGVKPSKSLPAPVLALVQDESGPDSDA